jgi:selenocysteine-specific elongation factor
MLIGTAGHIDHGKTSLVRRLTGRNTDRLPEEQARGISIELGYAYVPQADGRVAGFIDVPGHEKFVHTMVAGATGIDFALLVVAADDGVMPQTREHLEILELLGVNHGAIALTKIDLAGSARAAQVRQEIAAWLQGRPAAQWPLFALSAVSGEGVPALQAHLAAAALAHQAQTARGHFRLAVDRVFTLGGVGTIVTGAAHSGAVRVGDAVHLLPAPGGRVVEARVRSIHAQDQPAEVGMAGQRCALNLAGVERRDVARGQWVQHAALANTSTRIDAWLQVSPQAARVTDRMPVHLHHGAADVLGRVTLLRDARLEPGASGPVSLALDAPLALARGDRFIVRDTSARHTLGGGRVLDIAPPARGRRTPARLALLDALHTLPAVEALQHWVEQQVVPLDRLTHGWNLLAAESQALGEASGARLAAGSLLSAARWQALGAAISTAVAAAHQREPEMPGLEQQRLRRVAAPSVSPEAFAELLDELLADGTLVRRGAFIALPGHTAELKPAQRVQWERIKPLLLTTPFGPPRVRDIAADLAWPEAEVRALLRAVARLGEVTLVAPDHFFLTDAVASMADIAAALASDSGAARAAAFRDRIGGGRKVAILILEFFDRVGYTRRLRDDHVPRRDNPWRAALPRAS